MSDRRNVRRLALRISDLVKKCVAYVGVQKTDGTIAIRGTGFFVAKPVPGYRAERASKGLIALSGMFLYFITARHVIEGARSLGVDELVVRANLKAGGYSCISCPLARFKFHPDPTVDLAMVHADDGLPAYDLNPWLITNGVVTDDVIDAHNIGVGTSIAIVGLFRHHAGTERNLPIVRTGNIAAMAEEKVRTKLGFMDAILIEARSLGGLSGSPVFANMGPTWIQDYPIPHSEEVSGTFLLGVMHGHFDESVDGESVNVGIGVVTPAKKVLELLELTDVVADEMKVLERQRARDLLGRQR